MDNVRRALLHDMTLAARDMLMVEVQDILEGIYGLHRDGQFEAVDRLPAIQYHEEVQCTRGQLEQLLKDKCSAGLPASEAVERFIKEVAFTWLNRLAAFKMLEARKLIRVSITKGMQSDGFLRWVVEPTNAEDYRHYENGMLPQDNLGEGPRDIAYRHYLLHVCAEQADQINVLFDPDALSSRLCPRPRVLTNLLDLINTANLANAWADDETIGWIYQYFNEQEKKEIFEQINKKKITTSEIPAATQLFTPQWIVKALVQNSLGRLWIQMHPDSRLLNQLDYLVPDPDAPAVPLRLVREITLLDPACGTMHFGLVAFDLFAEMYQEEIDRTGDPGWPNLPSVQNSNDVPAAIIEHNLFGIDIDLRAVQLSALALLLKARALNPNAHITDHNLACASVAPLDGSHLAVFLETSHFEHSIYIRLIQGIWDRLKNMPQLGSLVRLESDVNSLVESEKTKTLAEQIIPHLPGFASEQFETEAERIEFWENIAKRIIHAFGEFATRNVAQGQDEHYFTGEATKGLRVLRLMLRHYDVVAANPPYMSNRNMSVAMNEYLKWAYPNAKGDLYAAFIERCVELTSSNGRTAMITQQSFMSISSYELMRKQLLNRTVIETMIHVGPHAFAEIEGEKVNTTLFVLRQELDATRRNNANGTYFRLVSEPDAEAKQRSFERAVSCLQIDKHDPIIYHYRQSDFDVIPGAPWVYYITPTLRTLFHTLPKLESKTDVCIGMRTGDNNRFLRFWWEVGTSRIRFGCSGADEAYVSGQRWFPYMKGGNFQRWYGNQAYVVEWYKDGAIIKENTKHNYPQLKDKLGWKISNEQFYFRRGVTYSYLTSGAFNARLSPGGFIFDVAGSSLFSSDISLLLAVMNSTFAAYALRMINPTINFQVGDLKKLPIPTTTSDKIRILVDQAVAMQRVRCEEDETTYEFVGPPSWPPDEDIINVWLSKLAAIECAIDNEVYNLYDIGEYDRTVIEAELVKAPLEIEEEVAKADIDEEDRMLNASLPQTKPEIYNIIDNLFQVDLAMRWISYAVGIVLGRFAPGVNGALGSGRFDSAVATKLCNLVVPKGIAVLDPSHPENLAERVEHLLELLIGLDTTEELILVATGGGNLTEWLTKEFFKEHLKRYRKCPIYWHFQSPKRHYSFFVFHERMTIDTLHLVQGNRYLGGRINSMHEQVQNIQTRIAKATSPSEQRLLERELETAKITLVDLDDFSKTLQFVTNQADSNGKVVGWVPEPDDGVLINVAPLRSLIPAWPKEPKKTKEPKDPYQCWDALVTGRLDWSHTAMRYWPERVMEACRKNRSYAIAHNLVECMREGD